MKLPLIQKYVIENKLDSDIPIGSFIYKDNYSTECSGFVYQYNAKDKHITIVLFEPKDMNIIADQILYYEEKCNYLNLLGEVFEKNPEAKVVWSELMNKEEIE